MIRRDYLIVGAGMGGASVCAGIRQFDQKGTITLVGSESYLPYERPRLIERCLSRGLLDLDGLGPYDREWFEANTVDLRLGTVVTQFNIERRLAVLSSGQVVEFRKACLAMGCRARRPTVPGSQLGHVLCLRNLEDALVLREISESARNIVVIGGGCVAAAVSARLAQLPGLEVILLHRGKFLWDRFLDPETGAWLSDYYSGHGVRMVMGETLNGFEGRTVLKNVQTKSGLRLAAGAAVLGWGVDLNLGLVANTPLSYPHGTPVNEFLESDEKGIYAVGDIAAYPDRIFGGLHRLDQLNGTLAQGLVAGGNMTAKKRQRFEWTPQRSVQLFDLQLELLGDFSRLPTRVEMTGSRDAGRFVVRCYQPWGLSGVLLCNESVEEVLKAKKQLVELPRDLKKQRAAGFV